MNRGVATTGARATSGAPRRAVRVMVVDDSLVARTLLSRIIEAEPDFEIVAKATTGEMAIARLSEISADVILLDLEMPGIGGIHALCLLLGALPARFAVPILVVQHLPESFMTTLARQLALASGRPARVAGGDTPLAPGEILVAPGNGHMIVRRAAGRLVTGIAHFAAPSGCMPSVDPLFETLADASGGRAIGVVLSGMGRDGVIGAARLVAAGGTLFAQDAATAAVWGMPRAVAEAGLATAVLPPAAIAARLALLGRVGEALRA
jgi:two-component system, chemotaxis family, protein-glutamate methylesterase/glutaminase